VLPPKIVRGLRHPTAHYHFNQLSFGPRRWLTEAKLIMNVPGGIGHQSIASNELQPRSTLEKLFRDEATILM
jgi:hypothetical protein